MQISPGRQKRIYALHQLQALSLETPELQRPADVLRVDEIVAYHVGRAPSAPLFIGDIILSRHCGKLYVVDGQHRLLAMLRLAKTYPNTQVTIEVVDSWAMPMRELFEVVNRSVPVPDYVVKETLGVVRRRLLDAFSLRFKASFVRFLSPARNPRRPNLSFDRLLDRIVASDILLAHFDDGDHLFEYIAWASSRLEAMDLINSKRARDKGGLPLFLTNDPDDTWASDPRLVAEFTSLPATASTVCIDPPVTRVNKRRNLSTSLRNAVWNAAFGGPSVGDGPCWCCGRIVSHQDFECGHVVAVAQGGTDSVDNLRVLCRSCNRGMGTTDMREFALNFSSCAMDLE
jgi:hypothetical protein